MDDDQLDESLRAAAREYHTPPEPPRDAMWRAIEAQRRADRLRRPAVRRWIPWAAAAAAVLAIGVGIGRLSAPRAPTPAPATVATAAPAPRVSETAYRLATVEHLGQSEAFLTLFRASVRTGGPGAAGLGHRPRAAGHQPAAARLAGRARPEDASVAAGPGAGAGRDRPALARGDGGRPRADPRRPGAGRHAVPPSDGRARRLDPNTR